MDNNLWLFIILLTSAAAQLSSCTRETDLLPEEEASVVVECILTEDPVQTLRLSLSDLATKHDWENLSNAVIHLYDETSGKEAGEFMPAGDNSWSLDYRPAPGHAYKLEIEIPHRPLLSSRTSMPPVTTVKYGIKEYDISAPTRDPKANDMGMRFVTSSLPEGSCWISGLNPKEGEAEHALAEGIATSLECADNFNLTGEVYFDEYYDNLCSLEWWDSFSVNYHAFDTYCMYHLVLGRPLHLNFLRIPPLSEVQERTSLEGDGHFSLAGSFEGNYYFEDQVPPGNGFLLFTSLSYEYDKYLKDVISRYLEQESASGYEMLFYRDNVYSNIENGIGIFGAMTAQRVPWNRRRYVYRY